jgi:diaminopimelate decarboxylase
VGVTTADTGLPAHQAPWVRRVLEDPELVDELTHGFGGPVHLLYPERFDDNVEAFRCALRDAGVAGRIFYAKKANKAACWIDRCAEWGLGVDVASVPELRDALAHGVRGSELVVTGPAKSSGLLELAARHGSLIAVDALDELARLLELGRRLPGTRVLLRCLPPGEPESRFGLDDTELGLALRRCADAGAAVRMEGFSFHLSGYDPAPRAELVATLIDRCVRARRLGLPAEVVDIGGGFAVDYVAAEDWQRFHDGDRPERYHRGRRFDGFYPYHSPLAGADMLRAVLDTVPRGHDRSVAGLLRAAGVTLGLEPGRALLDQAGCTVFTVQGVKAREYGLLTVDGTSLSLSEQWFASEFLPDPVLMPPGDGEPFAACVGGASCLESDLLTWRKVVFGRRPRAGDHLLYLNTAGYQMDSNESPFHDLPLPPKIVLSSHGERLRWRLDRTTR